MHQYNETSSITDKLPQEIVPNEWRMVAVGSLDVSGGLIAGTAPIVAWA